MKPDVAFGLLGPFQVQVAGQRVELNSPRSRALLATLLIEPGRLIMAAELIEAIWGAQQPASPRRALHVCLTRTRAGLAAVGVPPIIVSGTGGYRVALPPQAVDAARFRLLMERADLAAERGDEADEGVALTNALGLWRGQAFADVPSDYLHRTHAVRLAEQRMRALERQIDRWLSVGLHEKVISELTELTETYPLRERLWAQYLTALHQAGRRADALDAYHVLRRHLADELGIEPGDELRHLHAQILTGATEDGADVPRTSVVPRQLPAEVAGFTGRAGDVARLHQLLDAHERGETSGPTIVILTGMPGIGKTTLAAHWSRRIADRFPDGQLWLELRGYDHRAPATPQQSITAVLSALGVRGAELPADLDGRIGLYRSVLDGRRILLVLDNANGVDQVLPLIPGDARTFVLVTSRNDLASLIAVEGARLVQLSPFTATEARQMLSRRLGAERMAAEPDAVDRIIASCYGLPLALAIAAARAVRRPGSPLVELDRQLADANSPLDRFADPAAALTVRAVLSWSYHSLSLPAARLFRRLGVPLVDVSVASAATLIGGTVAQARALLDELASAHLVTEHRPGRFTVHDLLRAYASELTETHDPPDERSTDLGRLLNRLTSGALTARPLLQPSETPVVAHGGAQDGPLVAIEDERSAREWCETERDNLIAAVELAYRYGFDDLCWRLAYGLWIHLQLTGAWEDMRRTHETGLRAAERLGDQIGRAQMLVGIAVAYRATGRPSRAIATYHKALSIYRASGNATGTANVLGNLCAAYRDCGLFDKALKSARLAFRLEEALDEPGNMAISLYQIASTMAAAGKLSEADSYVSRALQRFRSIGHRRAEARTLQLAAEIRARLGEHDAAIEAHQTAVDIYRDLGDRWYQATVLTALGDTLDRSGAAAQSRAAWSHALAIYEELGAPRASELRSRLEPPDSE